MTSSSQDRPERSSAGPAKPPSASRITLGQVMLPTDANPRGNVHGGAIVKLVDEAAAMAATKHSRRSVVTVVLDSVTFLSPVYVGDLLTLTAEVTWVGTSSMEVEVQVEAENVRTGERTRTNTATAVYVALDDDGRPCPVPKLAPQTEEERLRMAEAQVRQEARLGRRAKHRT